MSAHRRTRTTVRARYAVAAAALVVFIGLVSQLSPSTAVAAETTSLDPVAVAQAQLAGCQAWIAKHPRTTSAQATRMAQCVTDETAIIAALAPAPTTPPPTSASPTPTTAPPSTVPPTTTAPPTTTPPPSPTPSPTPTVFPTSPSPTTQPNDCAASPHVCGFPDATNTGVPAGVTLTMSGPLTANIAGHVYEHLDINGCVSITASNVTIRESRITGGCDPLIAIRPFDAEVKGTVLDHVDIVSTGVGANALAFRGYTLRSSHVQTHGDCGRVDGDTTILDSFCEILPGGPDDNPSAPHYDGWQSEGSSRPVLIRGNTISNPYIQTSSIAVIGSNVTIDRNLLIGSRQVGLYCGLSTRPAGSNYVVTNNRFARNPIGPPVAYCEGTTWSGNVRDIDGRPM
jgi:hypothetical protein